MKEDEPNVKGGTGITRPDRAQESGTERYLHFLSPLSFRPPCNNKEMEKATRGKKGGERPDAQRTPEKEKQRAKKMIKRF